MKPNSRGGKANPVEFTVRRKRRAARSTFSAELKGLVDSIEHMLLPRCSLHRIYRGMAQSPERMIDLLEKGFMHPPLDLCVDARAVYDVVAATGACEPARSKLHLISVKDRMTHGAIRALHWVDARDVLAEGLNTGGNDGALLHGVGNDCKYQAIHEPLGP